MGTAVFSPPLTDALQLVPTVGPLSSSNSSVVPAASVSTGDA